MAVITDEQFTEWLASPISVPVVLAILTHSDGVEYVGTYGYTSTPSDTPANTYFEDILLDQVKIVESIDKNTIGDFSLINDNTHTDWLDLNWLGFPVKIYLGDQRWSFSNFRLIVDGRNGGISAPATDKYKFDVLDPNEALRLEIGAENAPLCFGEVFNCRPPMIDAINLRYKVNDGPISSIVVRDNGVVLTGGGVGYTLDAANGEFDLTASPAGQITCDVTQADNTAAQIITAITNLIPVADENSRVWDIADAIGPSGYNSASTAMTAFASAVVTTPVDGSQNVVLIDGNDTPATGSRGAMNITDLSTVNPSDGDFIFIRGKIKHSGTGGAWSVRLADSNSLTGTFTELYNIDSAITDYVSFAKAFVFDTGAGGLDVFGCIEDNGADDGAVYLKDVEVFVSGVPSNANNFNIFPNSSSLGLYVEQPRQAGVLIREVMDTVGGSYRFNALSELEIFRLELPYAELYTEANAISQDDANATTGITAVSGAVMTVVTDPSSGGGTYALEVESNTTPINGGRASIDLSSFFSGGEFLTIKIDAKHIGTGGAWRFRVADTGPADNIFTQFATLANTDTEYEQYSLSFTYSANTRYLVFRESNGANDGGVILDNLRIESSVALSPDDVFSIESSGIKSLGQEPPIRKMELGYQRNWNVQQADALAGSVGIQDREDFSREYRYAEKVNSLADFPLAKDKRLGTLFELEADAQTEVDRRQVIRSTKRGTFFVKSFLAPGQVKIGETIVIDYPDYGFDGGVPVRIIETQRFLGRGKIDLVVWK
jgi:hypothetical protein